MSNPEIPGLHYSAALPGHTADRRRLASVPAQHGKRYGCLWNRQIPLCFAERGPHCRSDHGGLSGGYHFRQLHAEGIPLYDTDASGHWIHCPVSVSDRRNERGDGQTAGNEMRS